MSFPKVAVICGLLAALFLTGCGVTAKPEAGTQHLLSAAGFHGAYDDQRGARASCLRNHDVPFHEYLTQNKINGVRQRLQAIQIGKPPDGATIIFYPEAEVAEGQQIMGLSVGSELIGSALLYPNKTSGGKLTTVENCVANGIGS